MKLIKMAWSILEEMMKRANQGDRECDEIPHRDGSGGTMFLT